MSVLREQGSRSACHAEVRAAALILKDEFEVSFAFYDAESREMVGESGPAGTSWPDMVWEAAQAGQSRVFDLVDGHYVILIVLHDAAPARLVALGRLPGLIGSGPAQQREQRRLQKWVSGLSARLCLSQQVAAGRQLQDEQAAQLQRAWGLLLDVAGAARRQRSPKDPVANRSRILKAARQALEVQAVLWLPDGHGATPLVEGDNPLAPDDARPLAALLSARSEPGSGKPLLWTTEQLAEMSRPPRRVVNLLAFPVQTSCQPGWLIAFNKVPSGHPVKPRDFRSADAAAFSPFAALFEMQLRNAKHYQEVRDLLIGLVRAMTAALDARNADTEGHSDRVARVGVEIAREMGLSQDEQSNVYLAGLLHDIGKVGVPDAILSKPAKLTAAEYDAVKRHVEIGHRLLANLEPLHDVLPGVLHHHERVDGRGYPHGLAGETIPLLARILAVADAYDAMTSQRAYRLAISPERVEDILRSGAGSQWDVDVVHALFACAQRIRGICTKRGSELFQRAIEGAVPGSWSSELVQLLAPAVPED
jgi:hypothetical protein